MHHPELSFAATVYRAEQLNRVAFPLGGLGAGMVALEGSGALSHISLRHKPEVYNEPLMFSALYVAGAPTARVLEGPVPSWKTFGAASSGNGGHGKNYGLPRFADCTFSARFPFASILLSDPAMPVTAEISGWSPFIPGDADRSSLPVFALEYTFRNHSALTVDAVYSFHAANFMRISEQSGAVIQQHEQGFILAQPPVEDNAAAEGYFAACVDHPQARVDCGWFRGGWFDALTMLWNTVMVGGAPTRPAHAEGAAGSGGSVYLPFQLAPGAGRTIRVLASWYVPRSDVRCGSDPHTDVGEACATGCCGNHPSCAATTPVDSHVPWYAARFPSINDIADYWRREYPTLREDSRRFSECFHDTTLPAAVIEAVAANLTILKSPTCLRQADGRFWAWEGCCDNAGCCHGSCTHVWNYAQALPHLFPELERSLRETEFFVNQDERGHQNFRTNLPIRPPVHDFHAAADGQLGGIMKVHRDWRISGDTDWLSTLWPKVKQSLLYCVETWDPEHNGLLVEPHHNTYDIEFWGADGMCTSFYLGALAAGITMGQACLDDVSLFEALLKRGRTRMECDLWNGEYFIQQVQWQDLRAGDPTTQESWSVNYSPEAQALLREEGPKYQYGKGCLADGALGDWLARCCGVDSTLHPRLVARHLQSVFQHNYKDDLSSHSNPQRPTYALGKEAGLLLCSWPHGGKPALPFVYSDEVWTGIEYQVASHLMMLGNIDAGLVIVRGLRARYDGRVRNPFNEYECGHWYARAMASYGLLQALSGARYDAVEQVLYVQPGISGNFRAFLCTAGGYGTVGRRNGEVFLDVVSGNIPLKAIITDSPES